MLLLYLIKTVRATISVEAQQAIALIALLGNRQKADRNKKTGRAPFVSVEIERALGALRPSGRKSCNRRRRWS